MPYRNLTISRPISRNWSSQICRNVNHQLTHSLYQFCHNVNELSMICVIQKWLALAFPTLTRLPDSQLKRELELIPGLCQNPGRCSLAFFAHFSMVFPWFANGFPAHVVHKIRIRSVRTYLDVFESKSIAHIDFDTTSIDGRNQEFYMVTESHLSFRVCSIIPLPRSQHPWLCYEPSQSLWEDCGREMALCHGLCSLDRNWVQSRAMPSLRKFHSVCVLTLGFRAESHLLVRHVGQPG